MSGRRTGEPVNEETLRATPGWHFQVRSRYTPTASACPAPCAVLRKLKRLEEKAGAADRAAADRLAGRFRQQQQGSGETRTDPDVNGGDLLVREASAAGHSGYKVLKSAGMGGLDQA